VSFGPVLDALPLGRLAGVAASASTSAVDRALTAAPLDLESLAVLLSPAAGERLEALARAARAMTLRHFGGVIQLYAPLYLSNECSQDCVYCGFRAPNRIERRTLTPEQVEAEADVLHRRGIRHLLLVSGEHPRAYQLDDLEAIVARLHSRFPSLSVEVQPLDREGYTRLGAAGLEGLTLYQETYDRTLYREVHRKGIKRDFDRRLDAVEAGAAAGLRRVGLGALLGLGDWRREALCVAAHVRYLERRYWRTFVTVSVPRLRRAAGAIDVPHPVGDRELAQLICVFRLALPRAGLVLSTRESASLRDGLVKLGVTQMSAGSRTEPGGYLHPDDAEGQFQVEDSRSPAEMAERLKGLGYDPVFKDWEGLLHA